jgi:hypothetical protein
MSRLSTMSPEAIKQVFSPDADADLITLLTFYDEDDNTVIARIADNYTKRLSETADDVIYGVSSNGEDYIFLPFQMVLPSEESDSPPRASITMNDVTRYLIPIIRELTQAPRVEIQLVLTKTPDIVEVSFGDMYVSNFNYSADSVTAELSPLNVEAEPFPSHSFTPAYFPGLF